MLNDAEKDGIFPLQALLALIPLLPKPLGGDRPIFLATQFYVLWAGLRRPWSSEWEEKKAGFWDDAIKGSSALQAGLRRRLFDEIAAAHGLATASLFWDLEKFYDTIDVYRLARLAAQEGYPMKMCTMDLYMHTAPRMLKWHTM